MNIVYIYTDGSCNYRNKLGGIGIYVKWYDEQKKLNEYKVSRGYKETTIGRMELIAVIEALKSIEDKSYLVVIFCDSEYIVNAVNKKWLFRWERENWEGRKNSDLWVEFLREYRRFRFGNVVMKWVRGHNENVDNEVAHNLCSYRNFTEYTSDNLKSL